LKGLTNANDRKTFVNKHAALTDIAPGPVRTTMALLFGEGDKSGPVSSRFLEAMHSEYATHLSWNVVGNGV
jgi:hypothetical protein